MTCEVARSPCPEPTVDENWMKMTEDGGFDPIADFNAKYCGDDDNTVDPQALSNPSSPADSLNDAFNPTGFDQTHSLGPTVLGAYPTDFTNNAAPYYHTVELQNTPSPPFASSGLRHDFRRSVSEPPDGFMPHHRQVHSEPQVIFHRDEHFLGYQKPTHPQRLKSLPRNRQQTRGQPYKMKMNTPMQQHRYQLRRSQTQPGRPQPPRSAPMMPPQPMHPFPQTMARPVMGQMQQLQRQVFEPLPSVPEQGRVLSSRICTPTPEEAHSPAPSGASAQQQIDPMLMDQTSSIASAEPKTAVTVPLTVEELRGMITEAVQKAVAAFEAKKAADAAGDNVEASTSSRVASRTLQPTVEDTKEDGEGGDQVADVKEQAG